MVDKGTLLIIVIVIMFGMLVPSDDWIAIGAIVFFIVGVICSKLFGDGTNNTRR